MLPSTNKGAKQGKKMVSYSTGEIEAEWQSATQDTETINGLVKKGNEHTTHILPLLP